MRVIKGNLLQLALQNRFDIIVHGCNCFNTMKSGIAGQIVRQWPQAAEVDRNTNLGDRNKLGTYSLSETPCCKIVNGYTQYHFGMKFGPPFDYDAFKTLLDKLDHDFPKDTKWGFPLIGCGLAGGDEVRVLRILTEWSIGRDVTVVRYQA